MTEDFLASTSLPLGTYFGIPVRMHFTFLILLFFQFQTVKNPAFGIAVAIGMALSILLHEFGHALTSAFYGGRSGSILLWQFGGLAISTPPASLAGSIATVAAGPAVTLVLAILFSAAATFRQPSCDPEMLAVIRTLARFNWVTLVFNLIPAFPMDGGQLFRDTLALHMGYSQATAIALNLSRVIAIVAMVGGVILSNPTLLFASVFLFMANRWR